MSGRRQTRDPAVDPQAWKLILREVTERHRVRLSELLGPCQRRVLTRARRDAARRMHAEAKMLPTAIARRLNRDHTTILYHLRAR